VTPEQAQARAALLLILRLFRHHDLSPAEAASAVHQRRAGQTGPHTHLVTQEAHAMIREAAAPLRAIVQALRPLVRMAADVMAEFTRAAQQVVAGIHAGTGARRTRPAWMSPYGPPTRRRFP
jgi:hypothetical protein